MDADIAHRVFTISMVLELTPEESAAVLAAQEQVEGLSFEQRVAWSGADLHRA